MLKSKGRRDIGLMKDSEILFARLKMQLVSVRTTFASLSLTCKEVRRSALRA